MPKTIETKFEISKIPGPFGIIVETTSFKVYSLGSQWKVQEEEVLFQDDEVNVTIVIRGQLGQEYEMTMTINSVGKEIKGKLIKNGLNRIPRTYKLSSFNP